MMPEPLRVTATIKKFMNKPCSHYKLGQSWEIEHFLTPAGMCPGVYFNIVTAMTYMENHPECDVHEVSCPDTKTIAIYELRRIKPENKTK